MFLSSVDVRSHVVTDYVCKKDNDSKDKDGRSLTMIIVNMIRIVKMVTMLRMKGALTYLALVTEVDSSCGV